jgi:flagellar biosynthesis protein FlhF
MNDYSRASNDVRTFRAPDPRAALDAVKAALGTEAVILETREVGGLWGKAEIEVTAMRSAEPGNPRVAAYTGAGRDARGDARNEDGLQGEIGALRRVVDDLRSRLPAGASATADRGPARGGSVPPEAVRVCRQLVRRGAESRIAEEIVQEALKTLIRTRGTDLDGTVRSLVTRRLAGSLAPWRRNADATTSEPRVIALVGPTGVGKTTTIAKIAARALLESRLRVALITVDTYRIGASEHLGRYGEIMGVKTLVARDASSLATAVTRAGADLVLVDSAGRSDPETIANQMGLLRSVPGLEMHLVLSAASGTREIAAAARRYREHGVNRLIFSKLDEADGPGSVLSAAAVVPRPISCITDGQRVPDDLHAADGNVLVDLVVGPPRSDFDSDKDKETPWTRQRA